VALQPARAHAQGHGLDEGASTRMLVRAAAMIRRGITPRVACHMAVVTPLTDDPDLNLALSAAVDASF
jgi:nitric oxide reductase NorQ protein